MTDCASISFGAAGDRSSCGFTLIKLLVVIVVIAVLATAVVPSVFQYVGEAKNLKARTRSEMLGAALDAHA